MLLLRGLFQRYSYIAAVFHLKIEARDVGAMGITRIELGLNGCGCR
jgi:hypothetical protein